jgi:hypothetical protein
VPSEVEERIHKALTSHALERLEDGYRLVHPGGAGVSTLRFLPAAADGPVVAVAEMTADYGGDNFPSFHPLGVQRLNAMAVYGAFELRGSRLHQAARFSIYANEPAPHLASQTILDAFGAQLPIGRSIAMATLSPAVLEEQRAHHAMPREWPKPPDAAALEAATQFLRARGLAASNNDKAVWAELALSGDIPSRAIDPDAPTALLHVLLGVPHPIAGVGYLANISLPLKAAPPDAADLCRRLNALELEQTDFPPRLGAWGLQGPEDVPGYTLFVPARELRDGLHITLLWWCALRAAWLRDHHWAAGAGLRLTG